MSRAKRNFAVSGCVLLGVALLSTQARPQDLGNGWRPSPLEVSRLTPYCQQWFINKVLPANCDGVHHLCAGQVLMNRVMDQSIPRQERRRILQHAKNEVNYMFGRPNAACSYMNEARAAQQQLQILEMMVR